MSEPQVEGIQDAQQAEPEAAETAAAETAAAETAASADVEAPVPSAWEPPPTQPVQPRQAPSAAGPRVSFGFNLPKIPGQGEDSDPIVRHGRELGLVAVFDGMGGAGGTTYETPDGPRTGAYLASRIARDVVEQRMVALLDPEWNLDGAAAALDLKRSVRAALQARLTELNAPASGLR
ncbi:MAG TPA: hypothetical protein VI357_11535, partial [Mycobacteriales bacterium]